VADTLDQEGRIIRTGAYPELTWPGVLVGWFLGIIIAVSIGYASLKLGFSIEGSELAAILGFLILRGLLRRKSIVENNINQTAASAVNGASAGMMFSVPAIFILDANPEFAGVLQQFDTIMAVMMVFACISGAFLGIAFIIPLRKQMIDYERLAYPGGVAVATILKSPGAGIRKAMYLLGGLGASALVYILAKEIGFTYPAVGHALGLPDYLNLTLAMSLMTVGMAFIAGKPGIYFVVGGFACYFILAPILSWQGVLPSAAALEEMMPKTDDYMRMPNYLRGMLFRPVGIGMLIGGAITGIALALPLIISAIRNMQQAAKMKTSIAKDEMPIKMLYIAVVGSAILLFVLAIFSTNEVGLLRGGLIAVLGTLWVWMAGVILSECIGRTNWSPLSGMTLIAVTIFIVITAGAGKIPAILSSVLVGAAACVAMAQATDLMMDLKTGYLVGATPKKQQLAQFCGAWLGPIVIMITIFILHEAYGLGSKELPAPQGDALAGMIGGILGGDVPLDKYIAGAGLGALLSASGIGGLGILVGLGFYLPFQYVITYTFGTAFRFVSDATLGRRWSEEVGIPIAAGLIVGEALIGVGYAAMKVIQGL
jgi:putative OPT family oligopeptide transporter